VKTEEKPKTSFEKIFLHPKPVKMLVVMRNNDIKYATQLMKAVDCTYSHTVKTLEIFKKYGLVEFNKKGRIKWIKLTPDGDELALSFEGVVSKLSKISSKLKEESKEHKK
jgi:predicted transcriptional regulator